MVPLSARNVLLWAMCLVILAVGSFVESFSSLAHHSRKAGIRRFPPQIVVPPKLGPLELVTQHRNYLCSRATVLYTYDNGQRGMSSRKSTDSLVADSSLQLRRISWLSWWAQVILTVTSSVILMFAKNVGTGLRDVVQVNFFLAGSGILVSFASIFWTWGGGARLSRRLLRKPTPRVQAANMLRRAIRVGVTLNLAGMALTLVGAEQTVGVLAIKVLTARPWNSAGGMPLMATNEGLQPLDILVVQANTNVLFSHFCSLVALLYLTRFVRKLDPPSMDDYERKQIKPQ